MMAYYETNRQVIHLSKAKRCSDQADHLWPPNPHLQAAGGKLRFSSLVPLRPVAVVGRNPRSSLDRGHPRLGHVQDPGLIRLDLRQALG
jgi:hypothetical protein